MSLYSFDLQRSPTFALTLHQRYIFGLVSGVRLVWLLLDQRFFFLIKHLFCFAVAARQANCARGPEQISSVWSVGKVIVHLPWFVLRTPVTFCVAHGQIRYQLVSAPNALLPCSPLRSRERWSRRMCPATTTTWSRQTRNAGRSGGEFLLRSRVLRVCPAPRRDVFRGAATRSESAQRTTTGDHGLYM